MARRSWRLAAIAAAGATLGPTGFLRAFMANVAVGRSGLSARTALSAAAFLATICAPALRGQGSPGRAFDVVSIKLTAGGLPASFALTHATRWPLEARHGRFHLYNTTLQALIVTAYEVTQFQIAGGPSWLDNEEYDVMGKADSSATPEQMRRMLQSMLADRFKLSVHRETRELPIYELTVAKGGPKLAPTKVGGCITFDPDGPRPAFGSTICGGLYSRNYEAVGPAVTIPEFIAYLNTEAHLLGRLVSDKTRIAGRFDIDVKYDPCTTAKPFLTDVPRGPGGATCADYSSYPSLTDALREQLGLRLESAKGPVNVLVIDRAEKPSAN
jgi:uncharacterized protein (TIGR03435 family)